MSLYENKHYRAVADWYSRNAVFADDYGDLYKRVEEALRLERKDKATVKEFEQLFREITSPFPKPVQPTIWYHGEQSYSSDGESPINVTRECHYLLQRFLDRKQAIATKELATGKANENGVTNPSAVVARIIKHFGAGAVRQPAKKGEGYYLRVRSYRE